MSKTFDVNRRSFLSLTAASAATAAFGGSKAAWAAAEAPFSFQLSWIKSIQYGGYFAGIDQGFFTEQGLNVDFNSGGPNVDPVANVASGQIMMGDRPSGPLMIARNKGIPIKIIGATFRKSPYSIMSLASKPIEKIADLEGKTIAVSTSSQPLVVYLIKQAGLDENSVSIVPSSPDPSGLVSGQIDAYAGYLTNQGVMLENRGVEIHAINASDIGIPETGGTIYARADFLEENRDLVVKFLKGAVKGWHWALDNPEETARLMVDTYGSPGLDYDAQLKEIKASKSYITAGLDGDMSKLLSIDVDTYQQIIDVYRAVGMVTTDFTAAELCDTSFIEEAQAS